MNSKDITQALCEWISVAGGEVEPSDEKSILNALKKLYVTYGGQIPEGIDIPDDIGVWIEGLSYAIYNSGGGSEPTGNIYINQNGDYDVAQYASASVDCPVPMFGYFNLVNNTPNAVYVSSLNMLDSGRVTNSQVTVQPQSTERIQCGMWVNQYKVDALILVTGITTTWNLAGGSDTASFVSSSQPGTVFHFSGAQGVTVTLTEV